MSGFEIAAVIPYLQAGAAVIGAIGSIQSGNAAKAAAESNARVMERNAAIARQQGAENARRQQREARIRAGEVRAQVGGSGVLLSSFGDVLEDNARQEELDRLTILYNADLEATSLLQSAQIERSRGAQAQKAGMFGAAGSLLMGAANLPSGGGGAASVGAYGNTGTARFAPSVLRSSSGMLGGGV